MTCGYCESRILCEAVELDLGKEKIHFCDDNCLSDFVEEHTQNVVLEEEEVL